VRSGKKRLKEEKMKRICSFIAQVLGLALFFVVTQASAQDELLVGTLFPLTGPGAAVGLQMQQGVDFAIQKINAGGGINGLKLRAIHEDTGGRPDQAVLSFNRLVDREGVPVVISAYSSVALAIAPLAARKSVLVINPGAQSDSLGDASPYLLNTIPLVRDEAPVLSKFAIGKIGKTAAIIYENAAAGTDGRNDFKSTFEALGGKVVAEEPIEFEQTNYRSTLLKVAALHPDMVYVVMTQSHGVFADQVSQIKDFPQVVGHTFSTPFFGSPGAVGWYNTSVRSNIPEKLGTEFVGKFGAKEFGLFSREYFNVINIVAKAAAKVKTDGKELNGEDLKAAIFELKTFNSDIADITFEGSNTAKRPVDILQNTTSERLRIPFDD
jgi:branched-chain amino acid transport system substrate-binding protein